MPRARVRGASAGCECGCGRGRRRGTGRRGEVAPVWLDWGCDGGARGGLGACLLPRLPQGREALAQRLSVLWRQVVGGGGKRGEGTSEGGEAGAR